MHIELTLEVGDLGGVHIVWSMIRGATGTS